MSFYSNNFGEAIDLHNTERREEIEFWRWCQVEASIFPDIDEEAYEVIQP